MLLSACSVNSSNEIAIKVENEEITLSDISEVFVDQYYDVIAENLTAQKLIEIEAKNLGVNLKDIRKSVESDKLTSRQVQVEYEIALTKAVLKRTIDETVIEAFFKDNQKSLVSTATNVTIYTIDHELGSKLLTLYQRDKNIDIAESTLGIKESSKKNELVNSENPLYNQIADLLEGEMTMIMNGDSHQIVLVNSIEEKLSLQWPKDKELITEEYLAANMFNEKIALIESLKNKYKIDRKTYSTLTLNS
ncbi:hypothetical protein ACFSL6_21810 [Paenibacillus thailandensis]|uniref:Peptidylprolyl isomerase n=1 Tax=Paenibacillus thailandensis TaxID=393250 RepID=A0ABW5R455_9BACL